MAERGTMAKPPAWLDREERQHERLAMHVVIDVDEPARRQTATLNDLSTAGCRVTVANRLALGSFVTVRLGEDRSVSGWVAWSRGDDAGIDFAAMMDADVVEAIARGA